MISSDMDYGKERRDKTMKYKINYKEVLYHTFYVEADTSEEAEAEFDRQVGAGDIDFSDGEVIDTDITVTPVSEKSTSLKCISPFNST